MQFKYPQLLYALALLIIPIIVHLFQLRTFKKVPFTNVAFLKNVVIQTRKSAQLKKWLTLLTRLLLLAAIILAFAQPYSSKKNTLNQTVENVIYIDNSFSMEAKGKNGGLLKRAIQDVIRTVPETAPVSVITNSNIYKNTTIAAIKKDLLTLEYSANQLPFKTVALKSKTLFSKANNTVKNLIYISDFQQHDTDVISQKDSSYQLYAIKLAPVNTLNTTIDSAYISKVHPTKLELTATLSHSGTALDNLPVSLLNNDKLIAKTATAVSSTAEVVFDLPVNTVINGQIQINDTHLQFDNTLYFNINAAQKINVLAIGAQDNAFLKRIYTEDEFNFSATTLNALNYNNINNQDVIVLNELPTLPQALTTVLTAYIARGGTLLIIPANAITLSNYNHLLSQYNLGFSAFTKTPKQVTTINYSHPLYNKDVFEKRINNFQYPKVNSFYQLQNTPTALLAFEDGSPFLTANANVFLMTAGLTEDNSNFKNSPLIVPTLYNIAKNSFKIPKLYYTIGMPNTYEVDANLQQDGVLSLDNGSNRLIPRQQRLNQKISITTHETPKHSGIYRIMDRDTTLQHVSYNYNRAESLLQYHNLEGKTNLITSRSVAEAFETLKSDSKINALWKWFVIFAVILFIIEMLILKFFK